MVMAVGVTARVLVADPPWKFGDKLPGKGRGAEKYYPCLSLDEIKCFPLPPLADDAVLFLWRVSSMQQEAIDVARAWGFKPHSELTWVKTLPCKRCDAMGYMLLVDDGDIAAWCRECQGRGYKIAFGMGRIVRGAHEACLIATRGKATQRVLAKNIRSVLHAPVGRHSEKPKEFFDIVQGLFDGPYIELFARRERMGWTTYGNELAEAHP